MKNYEGIIKPEDYNDIEAGISIVIEHIYFHKKNPLECFGKNCMNDNLLEIIFTKNVMGEYHVDSLAAEITTNDCENVLTGLGEILMKLHLERMVKEEIKITLKPSDKVGLINYATDEQLT